MKKNKDTLFPNYVGLQLAIEYPWLSTDKIVNLLIRYLGYDKEVARDEDETD